MYSLENNVGTDNIGSNISRDGSNSEKLLLNILFNFIVI